MSKNPGVGRQKLNQLFQRDNGICHICEKPVTSFSNPERAFAPKIAPELPYDASADHIIPYSKGGSHHLDNLRLAHKPCNVRRGNADLEGIEVKETMLRGKTTSDERAQHGNLLKAKGLTKKERKEILGYREEEKLRAGKILLEWDNEKGWIKPT